MTLAAEAAYASEDYSAESGIVYAQPGGHKLKLTLFQPRAESAQARPAVVLIHGGAWLSGTRRRVNWYGRAFAGHGYVAISIDYRKILRYGFPDPLLDAKAAVRWMRMHAAEYNVDPDRIAVFGQSAGAHLAMLVGATSGIKDFEGEENPGYSSAVRAVINCYGPVDLSVYEKVERNILHPGHSSLLMNRLLRKLPETIEDRLAYASPMTYLKPTMCPTLFIHGDKDTLVPIEAPRLAFEKLEEMGVQARFVTVPGRRHAFDHVHWNDRKAVFAEMLKFLAEVMPAKPRLVPAS